MTGLNGIAKTIFDEVMDEIEEELQESLEGLIVKEKLDGIIKQIQGATETKVIETINEYYSDDMNAVKKLILGERVARIVTSEAKQTLQALMSEILQQTFDVVDELRNEIIGEVFEETEAE
ncbi:MAG: hypothetical protein ACXAB4_03430 [Candidatus Hodarchaeales archaeon]